MTRAPRELTGQLAPCVMVEEGGGGAGAGEVASWRSCLLLAGRAADMRSLTEASCSSSKSSGATSASGLWS